MSLCFCVWRSLPLVVCRHVTCLYVSTQTCHFGLRGPKHEPTEQHLRQYAAITRVSFPKDSPLTASVRPSKHKHSWFKHWYRHIKRWMNYTLHLPFRHLAGNLIHSDICFEFHLVIRQIAITFLFLFFFSLFWGGDWTFCFNLNWATLHSDGS